MKTKVIVWGALLILNVVSAMMTKDTNPFISGVDVGLAVWCAMEILAPLIAKVAVRWIDE